MAAAAIITAWTFSDERAAIPKYIATLARACQLEPARLSGCVNALARYYQMCFTDSAEGSKSSLFVPVDEEADAQAESGDSPDTECSAGGASSGDGTVPGLWGRGPDSGDGPESPEVLACPLGDTSQPQQGGQHGGQHGGQQGRQQGVQQGGQQQLEGGGTSSAASAAAPSSSKDAMAVSRESAPCLSREASLAEELDAQVLKGDRPADQGDGGDTPVSVMESNFIPIAP